MALCTVTCGSCTLLLPCCSCLRAVCCRPSPPPRPCHADAGVPGWLPQRQQQQHNHCPCAVGGVHGGTEVHLAAAAAHSRGEWLQLPCLSVFQGPVQQCSAHMQSWLCMSAEHLLLHVNPWVIHLPLSHAGAAHHAGVRVPWDCMAHKTCVFCMLNPRFGTWKTPWSLQASPLTAWRP